MRVESRASHLAGQPHASALASASTGTVPVVPAQWTCNRCHKVMSIGSKKSHLGGHFQEDEDDEDDARSVLYDVDTQWGLMPGGGAYKDSDHYY